MGNLASLRKTLIDIYMIETIQKDADIKLRIREVVKSRGGNASKLARQMNINAPYFASILNSQDKGVSATLLKAFAGIGINITWLLTGKGEMDSGVKWKERAERAEAEIVALKRDMDTAHLLTENLFSRLKKEWTEGKEQDEKS